MRPFIITISLALIAIAGAVAYLYFKNQPLALPVLNIEISEPKIEDIPLSIEAMRKKQYPGSDIIIEEELASGSNYYRYIASYLSDGLKIYGLLTIPFATPPENGWPAVIFNHGYIRPSSYQTTNNYRLYTDAFSKNGYVLFKPDYRGHGSSKGDPESAYYSPAYAIDALNALASLKKYPSVNPEKIGMYGHSMGGNVVLRSMVVNTTDIKAAVIWGGVVGSYQDLLNNWRRRPNAIDSPTLEEQTMRTRYRQQFTEKYGTPETKPEIWQAIDPVYFTGDINTPIQLQTGSDDQDVPPEFSSKLKDILENSAKTVEYYNYPGGDHLISSPNFNLAMQRSLDFFDRYLKD